MTNRELDAEIAVTLFDMKPITIKEMENSVKTDGNTFVVEWLNISDTCPFFSSEHDRAAGVLDACIERAKAMDWDEHHYRVHLDLRPGECMICLVESKYMESRHVVHFDGIQDLPRAICMFALKFWGKKV